MSRLPPHKRDLHALYWSHFWAYEEYMREGPISEEETKKHLAYLDMLWSKMTLGAKKMIDPMWEMEAVSGGEWQELRALRCPHCGWIHHVVPGSSGPPRCSACMLDMAVHTKDVELQRRLEELQRERETVLDEVFRTKNTVLANETLRLLNKERDEVLALQARIKGS